MAHPPLSHCHHTPSSIGITELEKLLKTDLQAEIGTLKPTTKLFKADTKGKLPQGESTQSTAHQGPEGWAERKARQNQWRQVVEAKEGPEESQGGGTAGQRVQVTTEAPPHSLDILSWISPSGTRFHHHKPATYPDLFFTAPLDICNKFVLCQM
jgi:hypothetical protein